MKKLFFIALLATMGNNIYAQSGDLYIKNNTGCDVTVTMSAISPCVGNACGDLVSNQFTVLSGTSFLCTPWSSFGPGWAVATTAVPGTCPDFQWVQIDFTWSNCPVTPIWLGCGTPTGGTMGDGSAFCTPGTTPSYFWSGGGAGCYDLTGSWSPQSGGALTDVAIDFH